MKTLIACTLTAWFALVLVLGANQAFFRPPDTPPLPILISVLAPLAAFTAAYLRWGAFRQAVLRADLPFLTAVQAWRAGGFVFLALHAYGLLPGLFAWPAGWGDIAIGVTAPWMVLELIRRPAFAGSHLFALWNILGILDLVVAMATGVLSSGMVPGLVSDVTTAPMSRLPLVVIPAFLVPLFIMLHLVALFQARQGGFAERPATDRATESPRRIVSAA